MWHLDIWVSDQVHGGCHWTEDFATEQLAINRAKEVMKDGAERVCDDGHTTFIPPSHVQCVHKYETT